jgi:hypothetical protein
VNRSGDVALKPLESKAIIVSVSVLKEIGGGSFIPIRRVWKCGLFNFKQTFDRSIELIRFVFLVR